MDALPPAGPQGTAGFSFPGEVDDVYVVIDYQNVHLTAHDLFSPRRSPLKASQIHPLKFAQRILDVRSKSGPKLGRESAHLREVLVFRGQPRSDRELRMYSITQAQHAEWSRDRRVKLSFRPLKYPPSWPAEPAREKGIDVEVALAVLTTAEDARSAVVILATHDTDLEPALRVTFRRTGAGVRLETAGWAGGRRLARHLNLQHTRLDASEFQLSRDLKDYSPRRKKATQRPQG